MKRVVVILCTYLWCTMSYSQVTDVITNGLNLPTYQILIGNELYVSEAGAGKISKFDITQPTPTLTDVVTNLNQPFDLALDGNTLYIVEAGAGKISKIDITQTNPTPIDVLTGLTNPVGLALKGNELYIGESDMDRILKIDITQSNPTSTVVLSTGINHPESMFFDGNTLYITEYYGNQISKIDDVTQPNPVATTVVSGITGPTDVLLIGNIMYVASSFDIYEVDLTPTNPTPISIGSVTDAVGLTFDGTNLYTAQMFLNKLSKIDLSPVSTHQQSITADWYLFPNPAKDMLWVKEVEQTSNYRIINSIGQVIREDSLYPKATITITDLPKGVYFLKFENEVARRFVKY